MKRLLASITVIIQMFVLSKEVEFKFKPLKSISKVSIAGSFNNWNKDEYILSGPDNKGFYKIKIDLRPGKYYYKFIVDDKKWIEDPSNPNKVPDNFGGFNSVIIVKSKYFEMPNYEAEISEKDLSFSPNTEYIKYLPPFIQLVCKTNPYKIKKVFVKLNGILYKMHLIGNIDLKKYWCTTVKIGSVKTISLKITIQGETKKFSKSYFFNPTRFSIDNSIKENLIWYQIFIDRFYNGSLKNDKHYFVKWDYNWEYPPDSKQNYWEKIWQIHTGGDLIGIEKKLSYLKELGINIIYLTPVFYAPSPHKYDPINYLHIDPEFAIKEDIPKNEDFLKPETWQFTKSDKYFLNFIKKCHCKGIKVLIDGVFNHTSDKAPMFKYAIKGIKPYTEWYNIYSLNPLKYQCYCNFGGMPEFREKNGIYVDTLKRFIFNVTKRWTDPDGDPKTNDGIDGWRLDSANKVSDKFWKEWNEYVHNLKPDIITMGEYWDSGKKSFENKFDTFTNYILKDMIIDFFCKRKDITSFCAYLKKYEYLYPKNFNITPIMLDSHDMPRVLSVVKEKSGCEKINYLPILRGIFTFISLYPQSFFLYYGDEVLLEGKNDPFNRHQMWWYENKKNTSDAKTKISFKNFIKKLIKIRKKIYGDNPEAIVDFYPELENQKIKMIIYKKKNIYSCTFDMKRMKVKINDFFLINLLNGDIKHLKE